MSEGSWLDRRPLLLAIAGPKGAGKTTYFHTHVAPTGLRLVNADRLAAELSLDPYQAAKAAAALRQELVESGQSFAFETVFSDPVGEKVGMLEAAADTQYTVGLIFIGLASAKQSIQRIAMQVTQGGHDIPDEKLKARFPRTLPNLRKATQRLPHVLIYDNSDLARPYRFIAEYQRGERRRFAKPRPRWLTL